MGNITWQKSWSSSDNGTILGGTDIQNIQADITTVVNGGITNTNINASAAIVESKLTFSPTTGHDHDGTDSKLISATNTHYLKGCELVYDTAATFHANPGVLELNGTILSRTAVSTTLNLATTGHWVSGSEGASAWYYVYAYNDTGTSWDVKLSDEAPAYYDCDVDDASGVLRYRDYSDVWYRCIGAIRNDSSSNILQFYQKGNTIWYLDEQSFALGAETSFTEADLTAVLPATIITEAMILYSNNAASGVHLRNANSTTDSNQWQVVPQNAGDRTPVGWLPIFVGSLYDRAIDYEVNANTGTGYVAGYKIGI